MPKKATTCDSAMRLCAVCGQAIIGPIRRGLCGSCYQTVSDNGCRDRYPTQGTPPGSTTSERFWHYVDKDGPQTIYVDTPCWVWAGGRRRDGYGFLNVQADGLRRPVYSHRIAYTTEVGPIPGSMCVLHTCHNGSGGCVRPSHLHLGSRSANSAEKVAAGRQARGQMFPQSKLTAANVVDIRRLGAEGLLQRSIADLFGVSRHQVGRILARTAWTHIG